MHRQAKTLSDVKELFSDYDVHAEQDGENVIITFPAREDDLPTSRTPPLPPVGDGRFESDSINFSRASRNAIRGLVESPRFWRLTTVAIQLWNFYLSGENVGIVKTRKSGGKPLTITFKTIEQATAFVNYVRIP